MKVIVTGSREFNDRDLVWSTLDELLNRMRGVIVVHGACPTGADKHADDWARQRQAERRSVLIDRYPANWSHGRGAGMARNAEMVSTSGASLVLAFFQAGAANKGTAHCVKVARRAGIEVREYGRAA